MKGTVFYTVVQATLLYGWETWAVPLISDLDTFQMRCLSLEGGSVAYRFGKGKQTIHTGLVQNRSDQHNRQISKAVLAWPLS